MNRIVRVENVQQFLRNNNNNKKLTAAEQTFDFRFNIEESEATLSMCVCVKE